MLNDELQLAESMITFSSSPIELRERIIPENEAHFVDILFFYLEVVIFVKSVQRCVALAQLLIEQNFPAIAIHRGMSQEERLSR